MNSVLRGQRYSQVVSFDGSRGLNSCLIKISQSEIHDVGFLNNWNLEIGVFYMMDRGWIDIARQLQMYQAIAVSDIGTKSNVKATRKCCEKSGRSSSLISDESSALSSDHLVQDNSRFRRRI